MAGGAAPDVTPSNASAPAPDSKVLSQGRGSRSPQSQEGEAAAAAALSAEQGGTAGEAAAAAAAAASSTTEGADIAHQTVTWEVTMGVRSCDLSDIDQPPDTTALG